MPSGPIPEISDAELDELAARIRPMIGWVGALMQVVLPEHTDLRNTTYVWPLGWVQPVMYPYTEIARVATLHEVRDPNRFSPTVAEVIAQIPRDLRDQTEAFVADPDAVEFVEHDGIEYHATHTSLLRADRDALPPLQERMRDALKWGLTSRSRRSTS